MIKTPLGSVDTHKIKDKDYFKVLTAGVNELIKKGKLTYKAIKVDAITKVKPTKFTEKNVDKARKIIEREIRKAGGKVDHYSKADKTTAAKALIRAEPKLFR